MLRFLSERLRVEKLKQLLQAFRITRPPPVAVAMEDVEEPVSKRPRVEDDRESEGESATGSGAKQVWSMKSA